MQNMVQMLDTGMLDTLNNSRMLKVNNTAKHNPRSNLGDYTVWDRTGEDLVRLLGRSCSANARRIP